MQLTHAHESDESLMGRVADGQSEKLDPLVRRYANPLLTFICRMMGNYAESEEIFQEVFMAVWTKRKTYKRGSKFRPWVFQIARNACRSRLRRKITRRFITTTFELDEPADNTADNDPVDALIRDESTKIVEQAVLKLPEKQRAVVVMRIWCCMPYAEIAECYGLRESTIRAHMHQALKALRRPLSSYVSSQWSASTEPSND